MIESLPSVAHLRYRGEPVEWREVSGYHTVLLPTRANSRDFFGDVYGEGDSFYGRVFRRHDEAERLMTAEGPTAENVAESVIAYAVAHEVVTVADETTVEATVAGQINSSLAELALLAYAARLRGESVEDYIIGRALLDARVSVSAVSATDPVAKQLLLAVS